LFFIAVAAPPSRRLSFYCLMHLFSMGTRRKNRTFWDKNSIQLHSIYFPTDFPTFAGGDAPSRPPFGCALLSPSSSSSTSKKSTKLYTVLVPYSGSACSLPECHAAIDCTAHPEGGGRLVDSAAELPAKCGREMWGAEGEGQSDGIILTMK